MGIYGIEWKPAISVFMVLFPVILFSQDHGHDGKGHHDRLALFTGTSLAPTMLEGEGSNDIIFVPTYGIEYEHKINSWFALGIMNEIELQNYVITRSDGEEINRSFVYVGTLIAAVKTPINRLYFIFGPGYEIASDHNFTIFKFGFEYSVPIQHNWDIAPELTYDQISDIYHTITFGLAIGKSF